MRHVNYVYLRRETMIDEQLKQRIKDANEIVDVIGQFVSLHKRGINYIGTCPFHPDKHPSMTVSPSRQTYKCFVCGKGGDVIQFVQDHEGMSFNEALTWLANRAGITLPERVMSDDEVAKAKDREAQRIAMKAAATFFKKHLPDAQSYLYSRGYNLDDKVIADFQIGYAPQNNKAKDELLSAGFSKQRLIEVGILAETDKGYVYDVFRDRVMFPYFDLKGNIIGYSGRYVIPQEKAGKYVNTGDTPLFRKGLHLFGLYQAKSAIARYDNVYLVEGQFDVTSMHKAGVCNVIAGGGTALTPEQVQLICRFTKKITLMYDSDVAGIKASLKHCETFLSAGFQVSAVALQMGTDPDDLAQQLKADTGQWLMNHTINFVGYFAPLLRGSNPGEDPNKEEEAIQQICRLLAAIPSETLRLKCIETAARQFDTNTEVICRVINNLLQSKRTANVKEKSQMSPGIYGLEILKDVRSGSEPIILTQDYQEFITLYGDTPIVYVHEVPMQSDIIQLRQSGQLFTTECDGLNIFKDGKESHYLAALVSMYRAGITAITVSVEKHPSDNDEENEEDDEYSEENENSIESWNFAKYYIYLHKEFFKTFNGERSPYVERCAEVISYADDSVRIINFAFFYGCLGLTKQALTEILKPYLAKRKSRMAINAQRTDDDYEDENYDPDELPRYVQDNPEYMQMFKQCNYYPKLNKQGEPVCYLFKNEKSGHTMVGDFYMIPLLHIYSDNDEENKRVLKINRRYYKTPLYIEVQSKTLAKKSTIEEKLLNLDAVNFTNGEEKHWTKIREYMSRHYVMCTEIATYGNQQTDGFSRQEDQQFFAFANGIFHVVDGTPRFDPVNELGVVTHNAKNYYLPAFSTIYAGSGRQSDKYELISQLIYKEIPADKRCTFEEWASLMNCVYKINDNGKWAILFAIMCAFRSNIHCIDRLFTAPFFMGPMSSGKTQIAISIRSLFISPKVPIFNLNIGTDAAMSTLMSTFRDVPVVLDEYNNKDISDTKFQALKGIVYDGDGRQKRKGTSGKEIENDKVYAPVIICGQETPQRDDNALMSRIIVCEVPKPKNRTQEEVELFNKLKDIEDPSKIGLSNVLFEVLQLRPLVMQHFRALKQKAYDELKEALVNAGEIDRLMKTASLFLATCRLIQDYTGLNLPFTYDEFFQIAKNKIKFQVELISKTDKLATFFKAMDVMIDTKAIKEGRDFAIDTPERITIKLPGGEKKEMPIPTGNRVLFLRVSTIYTQYARSSYNQEESTQSTIEQNLRSHPSYIGSVHARRFNWYEVVEVPRGGFEEDMPNETGIDVKLNNDMVRKVEKRFTNSSCIAINYEIFQELYGIDLQRSSDDRIPNPNSDNDPIDASHAPQDIDF